MNQSHYNCMYLGGSNNADMQDSCQPKLVVVIHWPYLILLLRTWPTTSCGWFRYYAAS